MMLKYLFHDASKLRTFICIFMLLIPIAFAACIHDKVFSTTVLEDTRTSSNTSVESRQKRNDKSYEPLKVFVHLDEIDSRISTNVLHSIEMGLKKVTDTLYKSFLVKPMNKKFLLQRHNCEKKWRDGINSGKCAEIISDHELCSTQSMDYIIPDRFLDSLEVYRKEESSPYKVYPSGKGVEGHNFLLFVISKSTSWCLEQAVQAYSSYCRRDTSKRPIAGVLNMCPEYFTKKVYELKHYYNVILHEMFHVLGFSSGLYESFKGCSLSKTCTKPNNIYKDVNGIPRIQFSPVVKEMQEHFSCQESDFGAPIEVKEASSNDKLSSHWHPLLLFSSIMVPSFSEDDILIVDKISLSLLESTGWYEVNYAKSDYFMFGKGKGCDFGSSCEKENVTELCTVSSNSKSCDVLHFGVAQCQNIEPKQSCGVYKPSYKNSCRNKRKSEYGIEFHALEYPQMCFLSQKQSNEFEPMCLFVKCKSENSYEVLLNATWTTCDDKKGTNDGNNSIRCIQKIPACLKYKQFDQNSSCTRDTSYVISLRMFFNKPSFREMIETANSKNFKINIIHTIAKVIGIPATYFVNSRLSLFKQIYLDFSICPPPTISNAELGIVIWKTQKFLKDGDFAHVLSGVEKSVVSAGSIRLHPADVIAFTDHEGFRTLSAIPVICGVFLLATIMASLIRLYIIQKHRPHRGESQSSDPTMINESSAEGNFQ